MTEDTKDASMMGNMSHTQVEESHKKSSDSGSSDSGSSVGKLLGLGVAAAAAFVISKQWPEVKRYLKMRKM